MDMRKLNKSRIVYLLCLLFSFIFDMQSSFASEIPKTSINFSVSSAGNEEKIVGLEFSIYKIGIIDNNKKVILTKDFKNYPIDITKINEDEWNEYWIH